MNRQRFGPFAGGPVAATMVVAMTAGCLLLWVGVPLGWLWVGSQVEVATSVGTALMVSMVGSISTILALVPFLVRLNRRHVELREQRGVPVGDHTMLEVLLVVSAGFAIVGFGIWFFGFSGTSPIPLNVGY